MADISDQSWEKYNLRLRALARKKLGNVPRQVKDEEDIAASAIKSFLGGVKKGRIAKEDDRTIWPLLAVIASRKCADLAAYLNAEKRKSKGKRQDLTQIKDPAPSPESIVERQEAKQRLLAVLPKDRLRHIAHLKLENNTNKEIAKILGCAERTVERDWTEILKTWKRYLQ